MALNPLFFVLYRLAVFNTVPRDDYAPYLMWLRGTGGFVPDSPYAYRIGSMLLAAPFMALPPIPLSSGPVDPTQPWLQATAALTALAYASWIAAGMLGFAIGRRAGLTREGAALAGAVLFASMPYVQITAIDPLAVALIAGGVVLLDRPAWFASLLAVSVPVNEKVALVLAAWLTVRCVLWAGDRARFGRQWAAALAAVLAYAALVLTLRLPGNAYQLTPGTFLETVRTNLAAYASARGILLNVVPIGVLTAIALLGRPAGVFRRADVLLIPALAAVALVMTQFFQAGRIVMHAAPIFAAPFAVRVMDWLAPVRTRA